MRQSETQITQIKQSFYLFINTKSGNRQGHKIMQYRDLQHHLQPHIYLHFIDLFDSENRITSINHMKKSIKEGYSQTKVVVCGGDGTLNWVINELIKLQVDLSKCYFGIIPIGTGNDFCRAIGWQVESFDFSFQNFMLHIKKLIVATICKYDIWDVVIETYKGGKILDVKNRIEVERHENTIKKAFANYVGIGIDARVTYTVEKIRTPYACINKMLYACVGLINLFRPIKQLKRKISSFTENMCSMNSFSSQDTATNWLEDELKSTKSMQVDSKNNLIFSIKSKYKGLVCLNSTSYMAGLRNVWKTNAISTQTSQKQFHPQAIGDGKIEFVTYRNELALGLERLLPSGAKLTQGMGPFEILFKSAEQHETTFLQIDGESMKILNLKSIRISKSGSISGHQINIMVEQSI